MSLYTSFLPKIKPDYSETNNLILKNKKIFDFYQDTQTVINRNKLDLKNLSKKVKEKHKIQATNPYYTITIMSKIYNEYFMNNAEVLEILKEFNSSKNIEELKVLRTKSQIQRIFGLKNLAKKEKKLLFGQMLYEFNPEKKYHQFSYCQELTEYLLKYKVKFLNE